jgi:hypothetical protein
MRPFPVSAVKKQRRPDDVLRGGSQGLLSGALSGAATPAAAGAARPAGGLLSKYGGRR